MHAHYVSIEQIKELDNGKVEWRMATSSRAEGLIPQFLTERSMPSSISHVRAPPSYATAVLIARRFFSRFSPGCARVPQVASLNEGEARPGCGGFCSYCRDARRCLYGSECSARRAGRAWGCWRDRLDGGADPRWIAGLPYTRDKSPLVFLIFCCTLDVLDLMCLLLFRGNHLCASASSIRLRVAIAMFCSGEKKRIDRESRPFDGARDFPAHRAAGAPLSACSTPPSSSSAICPVTACAGHSTARHPIHTNPLAPRWRSFSVQVRLGDARDG